MQKIPNYNSKTGICSAPHLVLLGAGASKAACPKGDAQGKSVPVMIELVSALGLQKALRDASIKTTKQDFEAIYSGLAKSRKHNHLTREIQNRVYDYFSELSLPNSATIYDYLILSLRETDTIATFNWDPFLAQAFKRNQHIGSLPQVLFLHGNVEIGICRKHRAKGFKRSTCYFCGKELEPTQLLYPVQDKDYSNDPFVSSEWAALNEVLKHNYLLTIFGYAAPTSDVTAQDLMQESWNKNQMKMLSQVNIVDIKGKRRLEETWAPYFTRDHYCIHRSVFSTWLFTHPRRSCEAFARANLYNQPLRRNKFPRFKSLANLQRWVTPLIEEEKNGHFTGNP